MPYGIKNIRTNLQFLKNTKVRMPMTDISYHLTYKNILRKRKIWYFILKS